ncbi:hypothetical protein ILUMI_22640 [Ignelater luminosus]|uniref:DDE-1 domain-containing protein n=1 Tax=Ignelater luminosus TaxID=2038154 RepID=A0A8K0CA89_IGNLU|nr:hypothetical protein ILUMI_22640 [Ignelater luminosus]
MMRNPSFGDGSRVFTLDETGLTTVQSSKRRDLFYEGKPNAPNHGQPWEPHIFGCHQLGARKWGDHRHNAPHCSHRIQPLDVAIYGPLKAHYNTSVDQWMKDYPGTPMSLYDISGCFDAAFERAMTPINILASFRRTGIVPFDRHAFTDTDFLPSSVTDRPMPTILNTTIVIDLMSATAEGSSTNKESKKLDENTDFISPKEFIGYPKAKLRKENSNKRRRVGEEETLQDSALTHYKIPPHSGPRCVS